MDNIAFRTQYYPIILRYERNIIQIRIKMLKNRDLYTQINKHLDKKEYTIITGARQTGKTTLIQIIYKELMAKQLPAFYISFENPLVLQQVNQHPENIFQFAKKPCNPLIDKIIASPEERIVIFIDEVQYVNNPSNFLKYLYDTYQENLKIVATGSSAFYIDEKFDDSLAGRKQIFNLKTLSFNEFLDFNDAEILTREINQFRQQKDYISAYYNDIIYFFEKYVTFGGYPAVVLEKEQVDKIARLNEIASSFIKKDIHESKLEYEDRFFKLLILLSSQIGNLVNKNELAKTLGLNIHTIEKYLLVLQKCYHLDLLLPFSSNIRKEIVKMPKVYFNDLGLRNMFLNRFHNFNDREDKGSLLENYVYIRLKELYNQDNIRFWRTAQGNEVDFVVSETFEKGTAIEVKFSEKEFKPNQYNSFSTAYTNYNLVCKAYNSENIENQILKL